MQILNKNTDAQQPEDMDEILDYLSPAQRKTMMSTLHKMANISALKAEEAKKDVEQAES